MAESVGHRLRPSYHCGIFPLRLEPIEVGCSGLCSCGSSSHNRPQLGGPTQIRTGHQLLDAHSRRVK